MAPRTRTASSPVPGQRVIPPETVDEYYRRGWWRSTTAIDDLCTQAAARPDATAVVSYRSGHAEPDRHTFAELELLTRRVAAALIDMGIGVGDVVSLQLPNTWQFPALVYGILRAGAVVNPLVPIFRHRELDFVLRRTESRALIVPDVFRGHDHASMAADLSESIPGLRDVFVLRTDPAPSDASLPPGTRDLAEILDHTWELRPGLEDELAARAPGPDDLVQIQFTSGTTGEPKGVLHSYNTIHSGGRAIDEIYGLTADDVCFMASTLAHQTGFGYGMMKPLGMGMTVVYQDQWDAEQLLDAIETEGITWTVSATAFAMDMIAAQRRRPRNLASFGYFICGGAPIPPKVVEEAADVLGAQLIAVWGMTENMIVTTTRVGDPVELVSDSDGTPVDWMEVRVIDEIGHPVEVGQSGDLEVRGPSQALGYFFRDDIYAAASPDGDWFATGDVARLRSDGGIRIVGRTKDLIIRGGENIPVAEVEDLLLRHPSVVEVAVVGLPDDRLGERACAVITATDPAPSLADLTAHLQDAGMAKQFWPERLQVLTEMPRTPSGKIQKFKLREQLLAH